MICSIIILQGIYLITIYRQEQQKIEKNKNEILDVATQIGHLSDQTIILDKSKSELERLEKQKEEIFNQLPAFESSAKEISELMRYIALNEFSDIEVKFMPEEEDMQWEETEIIKREYEIKWVGSFDKTAKLIEKLNQSYQMMEIGLLEISNDVQDLGKEMNKSYYEDYKESFNELVKVNLVLTLYSRKAEAGEEVYQPDFDLAVSRVEEVFSLVQTEEIPVEEREYTEEENLFVLEIGDELSELKGPGKGAITVNTKNNLSLDLVIKNGGYRLVALNNQGELEEIDIEAEIVNPKLTISSVWERSNTAVMRITIYNQTEEKFEIIADDKSVDCIQIVDEQGKEIRKGFSDGRISFLE